MSAEPHHPLIAEVSDQDLTRRSLSGDKTAFKILMQRHRTDLYYFAVRHLREAEDSYDVVQETFISVWESLSRYDSSKSFEVWLRRIALNKCRDKLRKAFVRRLITRFTDSDAVAIEAVPDPSPTAADILTASTAQRRFDTALANLPDRLREPLVLTLWEGFSQKEAAEILGINAKAIENRIYRAKKQLATVLNPSDIKELIGTAP